MSQKKYEVDLHQIKDGPVQQRQCRDVFCTIIFIINALAMAYCSYYGFVYGQPYLIFRGTDQDGNICGLGNASSYPYLYFSNPPSMNINNRICITNCPYYDQSGNFINANCLPNSKVKHCNYDYLVYQNGSGSTTISGDGVWGYQSNQIFDRMCIPTDSALQFFNGQISNKISGFITNCLNGGYLSNFVQDLKNNWFVQLGGFISSVLISLIFMLVIRWCIGIFTWLSIIGTIIILAGLGFLFYYSSGAMGNVTLSYMNFTVPKIDQGDSYLTFYAYLTWVVDGILILLVLCLYGKIKLIISVCKCSGRLITQTLTIIFIPIIMTILSTSVWIACLITLMYILGTADFTYNGLIFTTISNFNTVNMYRFYFFIFGTLWSNALIQAVTVFVIASVSCMWYYSHGTGQKLHSPVLRSFNRAFLYHFGSLAFGSLLIAIIEFIQLITQFLKKKSIDITNPIYVNLTACLTCCLTCLQKIIQFLNKNAFIFIALKGNNFCKASQQSFQLIFSNPLRYLVNEVTGQVIIFLGKVLIAGGNTAIMYAFITYSGKVFIISPLLFLLGTFLYSYAVAFMFLTVYSLSMDSLLICFMVDQNNQKQNAKKAALYAPQQLANLF